MFLLFFLELQGLWSLRSPCGCFHSIFCRITFSGPCTSFISALSIWLTFISVLTEVAVLQLNFTSLLSSSCCMCVCAQTSSKKVLGQWDTFICFDMQVQVIGSSVLDLQDKQWHIGVTDIDFRRTLNQGLELWQYAWRHECAWMAWIWNVAEASWFHFSRLKKTTILSKFGSKKRRICQTIYRFLIHSISAGTHCCAQTTVLLCPPFHVNRVFA